MPDMRGLTVILVEPLAERLRAGLMLAMTTVAMGGRGRVFLQNEAVMVLRVPILSLSDADYVDAGLPDLVTTINEALAMGVEIILCQTGMHLTESRADDFDARCSFAGPASVLGDLGDDRLLAL
jgi:predicted peroxiredoxin